MNTSLVLVSPPCGVSFQYVTPGTSLTHQAGVVSKKLGLCSPELSFSVSLWDRAAAGNIPSLCSARKWSTIAFDLKKGAGSLTMTPYYRQDWGNWNRRKRQIEIEGEGENKKAIQIAPKQQSWKPYPTNPCHAIDSPWQMESREVQTFSQSTVTPPNKIGFLLETMGEWVLDQQLAFC